MNRKIAKAIKGLAQVSGRSEKALKREYYSLGGKGRHEMKKEIMDVLGNSELMQQLLQASEVLKRPHFPQPEIISPSEYEEIKVRSESINIDVEDPV